MVASCHWSRSPRSPRLKRTSRRGSRGLFGAAQREMPRARMPHACAAATPSTRRRDAIRAGQQKYCAPYKCPKEKEAVQNRLSFKAKKGGCDALNSGAGMQMRGTGVHQIATKGRRASSAGGAMFTPARRNFGPRETRRFQSRPWIARTAHAERRGGTSTPQVQCQTVRADAHRRVLRPAPGLRLDLRHVDEVCL